MGRNALPALFLLGTVLLAAARVETRADDNAPTAMDRVCMWLGGEYVTPDICRSALCSDASDPCLRAADRGVPAVAALVARQAARNATATQASIQAAFAAVVTRSGTNATLSSSASASGLSKCLKLYEGVIPSLRRAPASVAAGRYRDALQVMLAAEGAAGGCQDAMQWIPGLPPENLRFMNMAYVARAFFTYITAEH